MTQLLDTLWGCSHTEHRYFYRYDSRAVPPTPVTSPAPATASMCKDHSLTPCPCLGSSFNGSNPCCHLHCQKSELSEDSIERILSIVRMGDSQFGKQRNRQGRTLLRGESRKWCPVPLCKAIIINVGRHLTNRPTHGIKKGSLEYQRLLQIAKPYIGLAGAQPPVPPTPHCGGNARCPAIMFSFCHQTWCFRSRLWPSTTPWVS